MNERARASWRRHAALLVAVLVHIGLLLFLPYMISRSEPPPSDSVEVAIVPPPQPPKRIHIAPAVHPAEKNSSSARRHLRPAPRLANLSQPQFRLPAPKPLLPKPPMSLPASSEPPATSAQANGLGGGNGAGAGNGSQEGNDYLIRLKAYIDSRKGGARYREPYDAEMVLVLDQDGMLTDIRIASSSGDPSVDDDIMTQLKQMSPFPKPPAVLFSASKPLLPVMDKWIFPRP